MPGVLSRYVARQFAATSLLILVSVGIVVFLADYVDVLRHFSDEEAFSGLLGLKLTAMHTPILLDMILPFAFLFGALISLLGLSRKLELVVARASGVSVWGFLKAPILVAAVFGVLATAVFNPLAVDLKDKAEDLEAQISGSTPRGGGHWFRQSADGKQSIVHAGSVGDGGMSLTGVSAFVFDAAGQFQEKVTAPHARYAAGHWLLDDAVLVSAEGPPHRVTEYTLPTELNAVALRRNLVAPEAVSVWSLPAFVETAERTGTDADRFRVAFHMLLSRPLFFVAMVMIAATVSLRLTRYGGTWRLVLTGAAIGFLLYAASEVVSDLGDNGIINPVLAAWLPPIVALIFGATALLYQEDG